MGLLGTLISGNAHSPGPIGIGPVGPGPGQLLHKTLRILLPGGGPIPLGPGRSGFSLQWAGMMAMLHGLRGRRP